MKIILAHALALGLAGSAYAQVPPANPDPATPAVNSQDAQPARPAVGANSFTEDQARERIESKGFTQVTGLAKDKDGIWRGRATRSGASVDVAVDYQGNVFPR